MNQTNGSNRHVYIDSYFFIESLSGKDATKKDANDLIEKVLLASSRHLIIPQSIIGEIISVLLRDVEDTQDLQSYMVKLVCRFKKLIDVKKDFPSFDLDFLEHINYLSTLEVPTKKKKKERLDATDILILAQIIGDPESDLFVTPDIKLLNLSKLIREHTCDLVAKNQRSRILRIQDALTG